MNLKRICHHMRLRTLIILFLPLLASKAIAERVVSGNVIDMLDSTPVAGANVMINKTDKLLGFAMTDSDGKFSIPLSVSSDSLTIKVTMMGYRSYEAPFGINDCPLTIKMEEGALQLQEVVVKADRMRENGDTITYSVSSFAQKQDKTIGDVLRRMPGIDVSAGGKIQYQGTDINKFYIEGSDLLGGKYGIATNGIAHDDIGAVEVMENHQPMQVLRG
ncbi:MAG: TonB-dependent receptor, partial [Muribaculaceae bacterium]|nr:TonB-dependent receptor [Muribaculaceae bacterium]